MTFAVVLLIALATSSIASVPGFASSIVPGCQSLHLARCYLLGFRALVSTFSVMGYLFFELRVAASVHRRKSLVS